MKLLYVTDLHGTKWKFNRVFELAQLHHVDAVINGGDMLPGKVSISRQRRFITDFLEDYFEQFDEAEIYYLSYLGNDDVAVLDNLFEEICQKHPYAVNMEQKRYILEGFEFIGFNLVRDYPFPLKDRCRMDNSEFTFQEQRGNAVYSENDEFVQIGDWKKHARSLPTIEDELNQLEPPQNPHKSVYIIHTPPSECNLDVCYDGQMVGSDAVYNFIKKQQPLFSLHGHIHECPDVTGQWYFTLDETIIIQPGQSKSLIYVIIDLESKFFKRFSEKK